MRTIKESTELAVNNYNNFVDGNLHNIPYFYAFFNDDGACACHCEWDFGDATGRYLDALILCNEILGIGEVTQREKDFYNALVWMINQGSSGLAYRPSGLDWVKPCANTFDQRSAMMGLINYYKKNNDPKVLEVIDNMLRGLLSVGVFFNDYFYFPVSDIYSDTVISSGEYEPETNKADPCHYGGGVHILPLMMLFDVTKDGRLLRLCRKMVKFILSSSTFESDGSFYVTGYFAGEDGHFHSRMATVLGMLTYASVVGDIRLAEFCCKVYRFAKSQGTSYGFFPEGLGKRPQSGKPDEYPDVARHTEICGTADMIHIALLLPNFGYDTFDDAVRFSNHLFASQLTDISWIKASEAKPDESHCSYTDVAERYRGNFTGRVLANDLLNNGRYDNMGCCSAAGGRALWTLCDNAAGFYNGETIVNLLMDCDNKACVIQTGDDGRIKITPKNTGTVKVRIPDYAPNSSEYIVFENIRAGESVDVVFECKTRVETETLCGEKLKVTLRGNEVIDVTPRGNDMPLYTGKWV